MALIQNEKYHGIVYSDKKNNKIRNTNSCSANGRKIYNIQ